MGRKTPEYVAWLNMKSRALNPNTPEFHRYGGRGITVCALWVHSFDAFHKDVGSRPSPHHSIDRIDNDGNYEPGNVRWATRQEQVLNSTTPRPLLNYQTISEAAIANGLKINTVIYRLKRGWPPDQAVSFPANRGHRR